MSKKLSTTVIKSKTKQKNKEKQPSLLHNRLKHIATPWKTP